MDEHAPLEACMRIVKPLAQAGGTSGLRAAEQAMSDYLATRVGTRGRLEGIDDLETELADIDISMHPDQDRDFLGLLQSFLEQRRRFASIE